MPIRRKYINISLIALDIALGVWAAGLAGWLPQARVKPLDAAMTADVVVQVGTVADSTAAASELPPPVVEASAVDSAAAARAAAAGEIAAPLPRVTSFRDVAPTAMTAADNPFRREAAKLLSGRLEVTDSMNRHRILSYCEHLRTSYTTRDLDFLRQVFSDNALIVVGTVVKTAADKPGEALGGSNAKVRYSIRSKAEYLDKLAEIFASGKKIDVRFADFRVMRHPTEKDIYGVTLRQDYSCGNYSDSGYLFLLWDFRNRSMPLIHVRTWQPTATVADSENDVIGISDFNLE